MSSIFFPTLNCFKADVLLLIKNSFLSNFAKKKRDEFDRKYKTNVEPHTGTLAEQLIIGLLFVNL